MKTVRINWGEYYTDFIDVSEPCIPFLWRYKNSGGTVTDNGYIGVAWDMTKCPNPFLLQLYNSRSSSNTGFDFFIYSGAPNKVAWAIISGTILNLNTYPVTNVDTEVICTTSNEVAAALRNYFDELPSPGQGTVTLDIPANGQSLNFASATLSKSISKFISGNTIINLESFPVSDAAYNIVWQVQNGTLDATLFIEIINSDMTVTYLSPAKTPEKKHLLRQNMTSSTVRAIRTLVEVQARKGNVDAISNWTVYSTTIIDSTDTLYYPSLILAKCITSPMVFEAAFIYHSDISSKRCILKTDGTFIGNGTSITGDYIALELDENDNEVVNIAAFSGTIKVAKNGNAIETISGRAGYTMSDASVAIYAIFAIPA